MLDTDCTYKQPGLPTSGGLPAQVASAFSQIVYLCWASNVSQPAPAWTSRLQGPHQQPPHTHSCVVPGRWPSGHRAPPPLALPPVPFHVSVSHARILPFSLWMWLRCFSVAVERVCVCGRHLGVYQGMCPGVPTAQCRTALLAGQFGNDCLVPADKERGE